MTSYIGLIRKDADSDFGVDFPDFPGCVSAGATLDEARRMAQEALELHVSMVEDDEELPATSSLEGSWPTPKTLTPWPFSSRYRRPQTAPCRST